MTLDLAWVDIGLLAFLALSAVVGLLRGFVFEVLSLAAWFVAYFAATQAAGWAAPYIPMGAPGSALNRGLAFTAVFVVALIGWGLVARLVRGLIRATPLNPIDRIFGAGFGLLRGTVALLVLAVAVGFTPLAHSAAWQQSRGAVWLDALWLSVRPWFPKSFFPSSVGVIRAPG